MSYQTSLTGSNFVAAAVHNPRFPFNHEADMVLPQQLDDAEHVLLDFLMVKEEKVHSLESSTLNQAGLEQWKKKQTY